MKNGANTSLSKETTIAVMMLSKTMMSMFHLPDSNTKFFDIVIRVLLEDT